MIEFNEDSHAAYRPSRFLSRFFRRVIGIACLIAIPALWITALDALPEARILGLAISIILIGAAGLCFTERR